LAKGAGKKKEAKKFQKVPELTKGSRAKRPLPKRFLGGMKMNSRENLMGGMQRSKTGQE